MTHRITANDKALYEQGVLRFEGIVDAYYKKDPRLAELVIKLAILDPMPKVESDSDANGEANSEAESALSFHELRRRAHKGLGSDTALAEVEIDKDGALFSNREHQFRRMRKAQLVSNLFEQLYATPAHVPDRLKLGELIVALYEDPSEYAEEQLCAILKEVPLLWGPWQGFKYILKRSYFDQRWRIFGVTCARWESTSAYIANQYWYRPSLPQDVFPRDMDTVEWNSHWKLRRLNTHANANDVTTEMRIYLNQKVLAKIVEDYNQLPTETKELIVTELLIYADSVNDRTAIPILTSTSSWYYRNIAGRLQWNMRPEPLLRLFNEARSEKVVSWALDTMIKHHRGVLKTLSPDWIVQQATSNQAAVKLKSFVVDWFAEPITDIQRSEFISHGLHHAIIAFLDYDAALERKGGDRGWTKKARTFACGFVREFMSELTDLLNLDKVLWLLRHREEQLHLLGIYLLFPDEGDSPYIEHLDLDFWTELLGDSRMHKYAVEAIETRFSRNDLTKEWYHQRLLSKSNTVVDLMFQWIKDPERYPEGTDFYELYCSFVFNTSISTKLRNWAWSALIQPDETGGALTDRFTEQDYLNLLFNGWDQARTYAMEADQNPEEARANFSVQLMRQLIHEREFRLQEWKKSVTATNVVSSLPSDIKLFASNKLEQNLDLELSELGYSWVLASLEHSETSYQFVKRLFEQRFPIAQLARLLETPPENIEELDEADPEAILRGAETILNIIFAEYRPSSPRAQFWRKFLFNRLAPSRARADINAPDLPESLLIPSSLFSLEWFQEVIDNVHVEHREFACTIASFYMRAWAEASEMGFEQLKPLLFARRNDVRAFISRCVNNPRFPSESIDIMRPSFTEQELYAFCFDSNEAVRQKGMEIIKSYPSRFGQPDKLIQLSNSSDAVVRALVVETIAAQCILPVVTPGWEPYEGSVLPQSASASEKRRIKAIRDNPPRRQADAVSGVKYLGKGVPIQGELSLSDYEPLLDFVRRQLFRLPPGRAKGSQGPRGESLVAGVERIPTWKNKRTLIQAVRDMAIVDRNFAVVVAPLFKEFLSHNSKHVRDACTVALVRLDETHELEIFEQS